MLPCICMLDSKQLFICFEIRKKEQAKRAKWAKWARILKNTLTDEQRVAQRLDCNAETCYSPWQRHVTRHHFGAKFRRYSVLLSYERQTNKKWRERNNDNKRQRDNECRRKSEGEKKVGEQREIDWLIDFNAQKCVIQHINNKCFWAVQKVQ